MGFSLLFFTISTKNIKENGYTDYVGGDSHGGSLYTFPLKQEMAIFPGNYRGGIHGRDGNESPTPTGPVRWRPRAKFSKMKGGKYEVKGEKQCQLGWCYRLGVRSLSW